MKIDAGSHVPIYLQIADAIRRRIASSVFRPGEALPSQRSLALQLQVNPNTVQRAYDQIVREGLAYSQRGKGLFVAQQSADSALSHTQRNVRRALAAAIETARTAGIDDRTIRNCFESALQEVLPAKGADHE